MLGARGGKKAYMTNSYKRDLKSRNSIMSNGVKCLQEHKGSSTVNVSKYCICVYIILTTPLLCSLTCFALLFPSTLPYLVVVVFIISVGILFLGSPFISEKGAGGKQVRLQNRVGKQRTLIQV